MVLNNLVELRPRGREWLPASDEESLCYLVSRAVPADRAAEAVHGLLKKFGSTTEVIRAPVETLRTVNGVCNDIVSTLKSVHSIHLGFLRKQLEDSRLPGCSVAISNWCREHLSSETADVCMAVCYSHGEFCGVTPYAVGTKGHVFVYPREIIKFALRHSATSIVVVFFRKHGASEMTENEQESVLGISKAAVALDMDVSEVIVIRA